MNWIQINRIDLKCCLLSFNATTLNHSTNRPATKLGFYPTIAVTSSVADQEGILNLYQKMSWSLFAVCCQSDYSAFWIQVQDISGEVCSANGWDAPKTAAACSQHWSTKRAQLFSMTTFCDQIIQPCFRSFMHWATKCCLICCHIHLLSCQPLLQAWQLFAPKLSHNRWMTKKMLSKSSWNPKAQTYTIGINKHFSLAKMFWLLVMF